MSHKTLTPTARIVSQSPDLTKQMIGERAYHFYEERGRQDGRDVDDWLRAEAELTGKTPADSQGAHQAREMKAVAA